MEVRDPIIYDFKNGTAVQNSIVGSRGTSQHVASASEPPAGGRSGGGAPSISGGSRGAAAPLATTAIAAVVAVVVLPLDGLRLDLLPDV